MKKKIIISLILWFVEEGDWKSVKDGQQNKKSTCVFFHNSFKVINEMHVMT